MTRTRMVALITVATQISFGLLYAYLASQKSFLRQSYDRIRGGITKSEVDAVFEQLSQAKANWGGSEAWKVGRELVVIEYAGSERDRVIHKHLEVAIADPRLPWYHRWLVVLRPAMHDGCWWQLKDCEYYYEFFPNAVDDPQDQ